MTFNPPFGVDKMLHFCITLGITATVGLACGPATGIFVAASASLIKEVYDRKFKGAPRAACLKDLAADTLGIMLGAAFLYVAPAFV